MVERGSKLFENCGRSRKFPTVLGFDPMDRASTFMIVAIGQPRRPHRRPLPFEKSRVNKYRAGYGSWGFKLLSLICTGFVQEHVLDCVMDGFAHLEDFPCARLSGSHWTRNSKIRRCLSQQKLRRCPNYCSCRVGDVVS